MPIPKIGRYPPAAGIGGGDLPSLPLAIGVEKMAPVDRTRAGPDLIRNLDPRRVRAIRIAKQNAAGLLRRMPLGLRFHFLQNRCGDQHLGSLP